MIGSRAYSVLLAVVVIVCKPLVLPGLETVVAAVTALLAMFTFCGSATAAFYINCAACHTVSQDGLAIVNFQTTTNLGNGLHKVFKVNPGQTAIIQLNVTNNYAGSYALNINNLDAESVSNSSNHLVYTADPAWTHYFPGTITNFFMAGCATQSPNLWTFNLVVKTNTPAGFYTVNSQIAGYYSSTMWSQQESFYVEVVATAASVPVLQAPKWAGNTFSVQIATTSGFTYYLDYKTNLIAPTWNTTSEILGDGTIKTLTDTTATDSWRFYHAHVR